MARSVKLASALLAAAWIACAGSVFAAAPDKGYPPWRAALDGAFSALADYDWGKDRALLAPIEDAVVAAHNDAALRADLETRLGGILGSKASQAAKQFACRQLSLIGTAASVPALAALLPEEDLSHMARYALERMPIPEAAKALRDALPKVSAKLKVGVINSLGVRRDAASVPALVPLVRDSQAEIASAAAVALGRIGTPEAATAVLQFKQSAPEALQPVATDACLDVADLLVRAGKTDEAARIYTLLNDPKEPQWVRMAAFQGLVAARPAEATPRLVQALAGDDPQLRGMAVRLIRETPGTEATKTFAATYPQLPPVGQAALLGALAERGDPAGRPAVLLGLKSADENVRVAAIRALGLVGGAADVGAMAEIAAADRGPSGQAARAGLARLKGDDVSAAIASAMTGAAPAIQVELIRALAARGATQAKAVVLAAASGRDAAVRQAAMEALVVLAEAEDVPALVGFLKGAAGNAERDLAEKALMAACSRGGEKCVPALVSGLSGAAPAARCVVLRALGLAGGPAALEVVRADLGSATPQVQDEAVRVLSDWSDAAAAPDLLKIVQNSKNAAHYVLAFRGYVRLAREQKAPDESKLRVLEKAMGLARRPDEKILVLGALGDVKMPDALKLVAAQVGDPALNEEACSAAVQISGAIWQQQKDLVRDTLDKVLKNTRNARTKAEAQRLLGRIG